MGWIKIQSPEAIGYKHYYKRGEFVLYKSCNWWYLYKKCSNSYSDYIGMFKTMKEAKESLLIAGR